MAEASRLTRAGIRRLSALYPRGRRAQLRSTLIAPQIAGPLAIEDVERRLAAYLLDDSGAPMRGDSPVERAWFEHSLLVRGVGPGSAIAIDDELAAIVAAPRLIADGALSDAAMASRFAARADDAIAAAIALLPVEAAAFAVRTLAAQRGPDEDRLHLGLLQAGAALAWHPELLAADRGADIVDGLVALLDRTSPMPLLASAAPIVGAICVSSGAHGRRARAAVIARLSEARHRIVDRRAPVGGSFLDEFQALDRPRTVPDEDYFMTLPDRLVAEAAARSLGRSAELLTAVEFIALRNEVLESELGATLLSAFVDGLIDAAAIRPLGALVEQLLEERDEETRAMALAIAARIPLDDSADEVLACLADDRPAIRIGAARAATMLEPEVAVPALVARLDDSDPSVCASVAQTLVQLGQRAVVDQRRMPGALAIGRTRERAAAARTALGVADLEVVSALLPLAAAEAERTPTGSATPIVDGLAAMIYASDAGIRLAAALVREVPDVLPLVALACAGDDAPAVALPTDLHAELGAVLDPIVAAGGEAGMIAVELLARFSRGDAAMVDRIIDAGARTDGYAQQMIAALAHVGCRRDRAADAIAPWLRASDQIGALLLAAGVAGRVLPIDHPLWQQVRELYDLGAIASAAAYTALVNGARIHSPS